MPPVVRRILPLSLLLLAVLAILPAGASAQGPTGPPTQGPVDAPQLDALALNRFYGPGDRHFAGTGPAPYGAGYEQTLGYLLPGPALGRHAIFSCATGDDQFLSTDGTCEGQAVRGRLGFAYDAPPPGESRITPIYRCRRPGIDHFVSTDAACESATPDGGLGYLRRNGTAILRFYNPAANRFFVSSAPPPPGFGLQAPLGRYLPTGGTGRHAIFDCDGGGGDYFVSGDAGCEGRGPLGLDGFLYDAPPRSEPTILLYRCARPGVDHFVSISSTCEGAQTESPLGYARVLERALSQYYDPGSATYWTTSGSVLAGYGYERSLGFLQPTGGAGLSALYGCRSGASDHFLSLDPTCEQTTLESRVGFLYDAAGGAGNTAALYRCNRSGAHFASLDPLCNGQNTEARLGYLLTDEDAPLPPPACATSDGRVGASLGGRRRRSVAYGHGTRYAGRARFPDHTPAAGVRVTILEGDGPYRALGHARTGAKGRFSFSVKRGPSRTIRAAYRAAPGDAALACSAKAHVDVRALATLAVSPHTVGGGGTFRFAGRVYGRPIPSRGKLVVIQAYDGGRWREAVTVRSDRKGRFKGSYRFNSRTPHTYPLRALVRPEGKFPFATGTSRRTAVRVR